MKFKVKKGTKLFKKLDEIGIKCRNADKAAGKLAEELKCKNWARSSFVLAGGIRAFQFKEKPENWKTVENTYDCFYPKICKQNKELLDKISKLPIVKIEELNDIVGFKSQFHGNRFYKTVGISWVNKNFILIDVYEECEYKPKKDMIEITFSEYKKLNKK